RNDSQRRCNPRPACTYRKPHGVRQPLPSPRMRDNDRAGAACRLVRHAFDAKTVSRHLHMSSLPQRDFTLDPADTERLANLAGPFDGHLRQIELRLGVEISNRGNVFRVTGRDEKIVAETERLLRALYDEAATETFDSHAINLRLSEANVGSEPAYAPQDVAVRVKRGTIRGRGPNQQKYLHAITTHDINFGIGPAGTGKTFLAVAMAVEA